MKIIVNKWRLEPTANALIHCITGETRRLGEFHFLLLETLIANPGQVLSRSFLMSAVWKNRVVGGNSLPTAIHALRQAIDDNGKQQEIIKTVPKKGYLFNAAYLEQQPEESAGEAESPGAATPTDAPEDAIAQTNVDEARADAVSPARSRRLAYAAALLAAIGLAAVVYFHLAPSESAAADAPVLAQEEASDADNISLYHLYRQSGYKKNASQLINHLQPGIQKTNTLLAKNGSRLKLYYHMQLNRFTFVLLIRNRCQHEWQKVINIDNWQEHDDQLGKILYAEVEKTLNEMPTCQ